MESEHRFRAATSRFLKLHTSHLVANRGLPDQEKSTSAKPAMALAYRDAALDLRLQDMRR